MENQQVSKDCPIEVVAEMTSASLTSKVTHCLTACIPDTQTHSANFIGLEESANKATRPGNEAGKRGICWPGNEQFGPRTFISMPIWRWSVHLPRVSDPSVLELLKVKRIVIKSCHRCKLKLKYGLRKF